MVNRGHLHLGWVRPAAFALALAVALATVVFVYSAASASHLTVTAVEGSAFGYHAFDITLFDGARPEIGPTPVVGLGPDASNSPQEATAAEGEVAYGPAQLSTSGPITVSTEGSLGPTGSVTSSATINNVNRGGNEVFDADNVSSSCTANESGSTGSTTITNGTLRTHAQAEDHDEGVVATPTDPDSNYAVQGHLHLGATTDTFTYVFNEQIENPDGSLTVNAVHAYFHEGDGGPLTGELIIGQVVCGVTAVTTTTTLPPTTTVPTTTLPTTITQPTATTTLPTTTTTTTTTVPGSDEDPTNKEECKDGGWQQYGFWNQGQCIRFVNTGKDRRTDSRPHDGRPDDDSRP